MNIERGMTMNATEFVESLNETSQPDDIANIPAKEYFDTFAGKRIISFLSEKVKVVDTNAFELVDYQVISQLKKNPLYKGRDFFSDMRALGFSCKIISYHQEEAPIKTYLFSI